MSIAGLGRGERQTLKTGRAAPRRRQHPDVAANLCPPGANRGAGRRSARPAQRHESTRARRRREGETAAQISEGATAVAKAEIRPSFLDPREPLATGGARHPRTDPYSPPPFEYHPRPPGHRHARWIAPTSRVRIGALVAADRRGDVSCVASPFGHRPSAVTDGNGHSSASPNSIAFRLSPRWRLSQITTTSRGARGAIAIANDKSPLSRARSGCAMVIGLVRARSAPPGAPRRQCPSLIRLWARPACHRDHRHLDNSGTSPRGRGLGAAKSPSARAGHFSDVAALSIVFDRPFRRGDTVRYGTTTGTVERIGLKTTRLRALSGEQVIMANTKLLEQELHNLADTRVNRITLPFSLTYQTSPDVLERLGEIVDEAIKPIKGARLVRCMVTQFGPSAFDCAWSTTTARPTPIRWRSTGRRSSYHRPHLRARTDRVRLPHPDNLQRRPRRHAGDAVRAASGVQGMRLPYVA